MLSFYKKFDASINQFLKNIQLLRWSTIHTVLYITLENIDVQVIKKIFSIISIIIFGIFIYFGINAFLTYIVFWFQQYIPGYEAEIWNIVAEFLQVIQHPIDVIQKPYYGHIANVSNFFADLDYAFFHGSNLFSILRQFIFVFISCFIIYRFLSVSKLSIVYKWIIIIWAFVLMTSPINWYSRNSIHEAWPDLYFFLLLSLYFYIKTLTFNKGTKYLYIFLSLSFCWITTLTFGLGVLVFPILTLIIFLSRRYKLGVLYLIMTIGAFKFYLVPGSDAGVLTTNVLHRAMDSLSFWRLILFSFAVPTAPGGFPVPGYGGGEDSTIVFWVWGLLRSCIVILLVLSLFFIVFLKPLWSEKYKKNPWYKKILTINFFESPVNVMFMGFILFSLMNIMAIAIARHGYSTNNHGYILAERFIYNALFLLITVFGFFIVYFQTIKKYYIRYIANSIFLIASIVYLQFVFIPISSTYVSLHAWNVWRLRLQNISIAMNAYIDKYAITLGYEVKPYVPIQRIWNNGGYSMWEKNLMGLNVYQLLKLDIKSPYSLFNGGPLNPKHIWLLNKSCNGKVESIPHTLTVGNATSVRLNLLSESFRTIQLKGSINLFQSPSTLFITNLKGNIVGLGRLDYIFPQYLTLWDVGKLWGQDPLWNFDEFLTNHHRSIHALVKLPLRGQGSYTVWALMKDRIHICKIQTIILPKKT